MNDRIALLNPMITPAVAKLVRQRLTQRIALVEKDTSSLSAEKKLAIKIALLVVHIINPFEEFFGTEEALIRGVHLNTLTKLRFESRSDPRIALRPL